jgi:hypothetical protein
MSSKTISAILFLLLSSCYYYEDIPRAPDLSACLDSDLMVSAISQNSSGCGTADGSISALATGGSGPYSFSRDGGKTKQAYDTFLNLSGGTYQITAFDAIGCSAITEATVTITGSNFDASVDVIEADSECLSDNGSVTLSGTGGSEPYSYKIGTVTNSTGSFKGMAGGTYNASVTDATSCSINLSILIPSESSTSYAVDIAPLMTAKCNFSTCHGGKSQGKNFTIYENVKAYASEIKIRTGNGNMPKAPKPGGSLTAEQIKLIACWVDAGAQNN